MIRPSLLPIARHCRYSATLSEQYPETTDAAEGGTELHEEVRRMLENYLRDGEPRAVVIADWMRREIESADVLNYEHHLQLIDPDTGDVLTEGTIDCALEEGGLVTVYDYKFGLLDKVEHPDENMQLRAYGAALAIERGAQGFTPVIVGEKDGECVVIRGNLVSDVGAVIDEIKAIERKENVPKLGDHCVRCYRTKYCHAYKAQTETALVLVDGATSIELNDKNVAVLSQRIDQVEKALKAAKAIRRDFILRGGKVVVDGKVARITMCKGKESASIDALKADGLDRYVKRGGDYERLTWAKIKEGSP